MKQSGHKNQRSGKNKTNNVKRKKKEKAKEGRAN